MPALDREQSAKVQGRLGLFGTEGRGAKWISKSVWWHRGKVVTYVVTYGRGGVDEGLST